MHMLLSNFYFPSKLRDTFLSMGMLLSVCVILTSANITRRAHFMFYRFGEVTTPDHDACRNYTVTLKLAMLHYDLYFTEDLSKCLQQRILMNYYRRPAPQNLLVLQNTFSDESADEEYLCLDGQCWLQWKSMEQSTRNTNNNASISSFSIFLSKSMNWNLWLKSQKKECTILSQVMFLYCCNWKKWYFPSWKKNRNSPFLQVNRFFSVWVLHIFILG